MLEIGQELLAWKAIGRDGVFQRAKHAHGTADTRQPVREQHG
jgi:hypothetical protein